jgi:outer membrane receptor protein involved in Fe transport
MKKIKNLLLVALFFTVATVLGQTKITGKVIDEYNEPLPGASIVIKGTSNGTTTDFNGVFELTSKENEGIIVVSYIGYVKQEIEFSKTNSKLATITLKEDSNTLEEIMVFSSVAVDRKTPVAVSTIKQEEIAQKLGNQEFIEILKSTPGVFTTRGSGGFGDGEITMRGFNSENVAVVINGIPVNDFLDGRVFWSNWAGIGNVTKFTQTQRGLGASKLGVPSIGGTQNIITETTATEKGGRFSYGLGNDGYTKYALKLSTGLNNGFATTIYVDRTFGDGYVDGTPFDAFTYFAGVSKEFNDNHKLILTATGAPQQHGTRFERLTLQQTRQSPSGIRTNADFGIRNGELFSLSKNQFHKPLIGLSHYWKIDDTAKISTSVYYSNGFGGITFDQGNGADTSSSGLVNNSLRLGDYGPVDVDQIVRNNAANRISTTYLTSSINTHNWYGLLSNYNKELNEDIDLTVGLDARYGQYERYREIGDLLGGEFADVDNRNINNPNNQLRTGDKFSFHNRSLVRIGGGFGQLEYDRDNISAFVSANVSRTEYQREDLFLKTPDDPTRKTDWIGFTGFGSKTGANYRLDGYHNVFFNIGYFERAPFPNAIWPTNDNDATNTDAENQKIFSVELGYGLRTEKLAVNVNVYNTKWSDRTETRNRTEQIQLENGEIEDRQVFDNITGINALHQGVEVDFDYRPFDFLNLKGFVSLGDWVWLDDVDVVRTNEDQVVEDEFRVLVSNLAVGRSAQTTAGLNLKVDLSSETSFYIDYNYYDRYFADFDPSDRVLSQEDLNNQERIDFLRRNPYEVPDYHLFDTSIRHKFKISDLDAVISARMYNVFNTRYITRADDNGGTAAGAEVFFGPGRTFSVSTTINF